MLDENDCLDLEQNDGSRPEKHNPQNAGAHSRADKIDPRLERRRICPSRMPKIIRVRLSLMRRRGDWLCRCLSRPSTSPSLEPVVQPSAVPGSCAERFAPAHIRSGAYPMDGTRCSLLFHVYSWLDLQNRRIAPSLRLAGEPKGSRSETASQQETRIKLDSGMSEAAPAWGMAAQFSRN
jgi:hypothetical protein